MNDKSIQEDVFIGEPVRVISPPPLFLPPSPHTQLMKVNQSLKEDIESQRSSYDNMEKKLNRKVSELQEVRELDAQAKQHLGDSYRIMLDEKDEKLSVLQTQAREGVV